MQRVEVRVKPFKIRCKSCGAESAVEASKPGYAVFVCSACGAAHLMLLDHDLNLRAFEPVEVVEGLPAGAYELAVEEELMPGLLRDLLARLASGDASLEDARRALRLAQRLGLLRRVGA
jgi:predicted RNA-binding Zn-ribbon protein involved in translation (DUF1610 family)